MKKSLSFLVAFAVTIVPFALQAEVIDKIVATVNQEPITDFDVEKVMTSLSQEPVKGPSSNKKAAPVPTPQGPELRKAAIEHLVDQTLLNQEIDKQGIKVSDDDINMAIDSILKRNNITLDQLKKELYAKGESYEAYRQDLRDQIRRLRYIGQIVGNRVRVSDEDVQAFLDQNASKLKSVQEVHIAQIVIPLSSSSDAEFKQTVPKAQEAYKKAKGGANFDNLIKEYGGAGSGDLGKVNFSAMAPQVANALQALEEGQVTEPIRTSVGILIVKMVDKPEGGLTATNDQLKAQLKDRIYELKLQEEIKRYVDQLKSKAFIDIKS